METFSKENVSNTYRMNIVGYNDGRKQWKEGRGD